MATSSPEDAPRGMEFLYSGNRFNVATSRARCACILVASPRLFEPDCRTPRQMKLANVFCRYLELAKNVVVSPSPPSSMTLKLKKSVGTAGALEPRRCQQQSAMQELCEPTGCKD